MPKYVIEREIPGAGSAVRGRPQIHFAEIVRRSSVAWTSDSVAREFRNRQQIVLRVHRAERGDDSPTRGTGWLPGESCLGSTVRY
jgi:hypothetical protein